jgi:hypothetical protein
MTDRPDFQLTPPNAQEFDLDHEAPWPMPDTHPQPKATEPTMLERVAMWIERGLS